MRVIQLGLAGAIVFGHIVVGWCAELDRQYHSVCLQNNNRRDFLYQLRLGTKSKSSCHHGLIRRRFLIPKTVVVDDQIYRPKGLATTLMVDLVLIIFCQ